MATHEGTEKSATGGATGSAQSVPQSIVDAYVFGVVFPGNYWRTLRELKELYQKWDLDDKDMLKLKLLSCLLVEQLLGQLSVKSPKVLGLMEEYIKLRGE
jgi:hypothetical protein